MSREQAADAQKSRGQLAHAKAAGQEGLLAGLSAHFPTLFIIAMCALYAASLGVHEPAFSFLRVAGQASDGANCSATFPLDAFARGGNVLLYAPSIGGSSVLASFEGYGKASSVKVVTDASGFEVGKLVVNGETVCEKCNSSIEYNLSAANEGRLEVYAGIYDAGTGSATEEADGRWIKNAFFVDYSKSYAQLPISIEVAGGWAAMPNEEAPSSFYNVDSPFHIHRIAELASYFPRLEWPHTFYTFFAVLPAGIAHFALGITPEYAYKLELIALFFVPLLLFCLFSRKIPHGSRAVFLFASFLYLAVPSNGLPIGSGADLFFVGLAAHTLATYLSLVFLYFAYEFLIEGRNGRLLPAVAFFALALLSNQRIAFALPFYFAALCAPLLATGGIRRCVPLGASCALAALLIFLPFTASSNPTSGYITLGGAGFGGGAGDAALAFFQIGYILLPFLFALGLYEASRRNSYFALVAGCAGLMAYIFAANPEVNRVMPFIDGIRLFPSFYLIAYFVAGIGCMAAYERMAAWLERMRLRLGLDRTTFAGAYALSMLFPIGLLAMSMMMAATALYGESTGTLQDASEISGIAKVQRVAGGESVLFVGRGAVSQHIVFLGRADNFVMGSGSGLGDIEQEMNASRARYLVFGNFWRENIGKNSSLMQDYRALASSPKFEEARYGGSNQLFLLRGAEGSRPAEAAGANIAGYEILSDRARVDGFCHEPPCTVALHVDYGENTECVAPGGCWLERKGDGFSVVHGIAGGEFHAEVQKKTPPFMLPLGIVCAAGIAFFAHPKALGLFSKK